MFLFNSLVPESFPYFDSGHVRQTPKQLTHDDSTVAWICPLEVELIAALEILDEEYPDLDQPPADHSVYPLGSKAGGNFAITGM
ncbi:hypothetical protein N7456_004971 [Penicillium angulare]|uniref:Uncharacterized protein n=1 Tax=Penicillium angulare TaxID=116970 RepID=A0A9W9FXG1_9EURO|nr:hypothetical protein N7456_004971 [Penicillium angulare]